MHVTNYQFSDKFIRLSGPTNAKTDNQKYYCGYTHRQPYNIQCYNTILKLDSNMGFRGKNSGKNDSIPAIFSDINTALFHF